MKLPVLCGLIKRRMLINFRVDPSAMQRYLPAPFRPKLYQGYAIAGICLIRLEEIRPKGLPALLGLSSENAAHRVAVEWDEPSGRTCEGVFIPRRDTSSRLNQLCGGRIFPGKHYPAEFCVRDDGSRIEFLMQSYDKAVSVRVRGIDSDDLPESSCFASLADSSRFFECGSVGYSPTSDSRCFEGMRLTTQSWRVRALTVEQVESSFFANKSLFPVGAVEFDHALIMREIASEWHQMHDMLSGA